VIDCSDLGRAADFWAGVLGYVREGPAVVPYQGLIPADGQGVEILLQRVPDQKRENWRSRGGKRRGQPGTSGRTPYLRGPVCPVLWHNSELQRDCRLAPFASAMQLRTLLDRPHAPARGSGTLGIDAVSQVCVAMGVA